MPGVCVLENSTGNFIRSIQVFGDYTLTNLQQEGIPQICKPEDLQPPTNLIATVSVTNPSTQIDLEWTVNGFQQLGFQIWRGQGSETKTLVDTVGSTTDTYIDDNGGSGLSSGIEYCYEIRAFGPDSTFSAFSNEACAMTLSLGILLDGSSEIQVNTSYILGDGQSSSNNFSLRAFFRIDLQTLLNKYFIEEQAGDRFWWIVNGQLGNPGVDNKNRVLFDKNGRVIRSASSSATQTANEVGSYYMGFDRITNTVTNFLQNVNDNQVTSQDNNGQSNMIATDILSLPNYSIGRDIVGVLGNLWLFTGSTLTTAQDAWLFAGGDPTSSEAKNQGIGIDGVDTIGVGGITILATFIMDFNKVTFNGGSYYVRDEISNNDLYGLLVNFPDPANSIVPFDKFP